MEWWRTTSTGPGLNRPDGRDQIPKSCTDRAAVSLPLKDPLELGIIQPRGLF